MQIYQSSVPGEVAVVTFDVSLDAGESECAALHADGPLYLIDAEMTFDSPFYDIWSQAADMAVQVVQ